MQADHRHDPVHHEDAPGHVPRLLEHRDGGEEQHDLRHENQHRPNAADDPVRHERRKDRGRPHARKRVENDIPAPADGGFENVRDRVSQKIRHLEDAPRRREEDNEAEKGRRHDPVDPVRDGKALPVDAPLGDHGRRRLRDETPPPFDRRGVEPVAEALRQQRVLFGEDPARLAVGRELRNAVHDDRVPFRQPKRKHPHPAELVGRGARRSRHRGFEAGDGALDIRAVRHADRAAPKGAGAPHRAFQRVDAVSLREAARRHAPDARAAGGAAGAISARQRRDDGRAETSRQRVEIDVHAAADRQVSHIHDEQGGDIEFQNLNGEIEASFEVRRVQHDRDEIGGA